MDDDWTLGELSARAARALAAGRVQVSSGRVSGVPDGRLIRWYATIGLVDRPRIGPGRTARYGERQLLQVVAIKRLQAQGLSLAAIRERLGAASDEDLGRLARLGPEESAAGMDARGGPVADPAENSLVAAPIHGVSVGGLTMLLAVEPTAEDLTAIGTAAGPLLDLLAGRGLIAGARPDSATSAHPDRGMPAPDLHRADEGTLP